MGSAQEDPIPTVDISPFVSEANVESRQHTAKDFARKCARNGCLAIVGHGVSSELLEQAFALSKKLFDLPLEAKMRAPHPDALLPHRGYSYVGREKGATKSTTDTYGQDSKKASVRPTEYKESYEIGSDENMLEPNIWLPEEVFPGFRDFTTQIYGTLAATASAVMHLIAESLQLEAADISNMWKLLTGKTNQLRLLHYLPISAEVSQGDDLARLGAHTDWSYFTLLFQKSQGGLEFLDRETQEFVPAPPKEGVLYMNIGDMITRLSNGRFPSAKHRVTVPAPDADGTVQERYSIAYFVIPALDDEIAPQPTLVQRDDGEARYEPVIFEEYARMRFKNRQLRSEEEYKALEKKNGGFGHGEA